MPPGHHHVTERGFSLVEVLIASTILIAGLVSLAQLFTVATASNISARHTTYATALAAQKIEELRAAAPDPGAPPGGADDAGVYTRRWSTVPLPGAADAMVVEVLVTSRAAGPAAEARLVTVIARRAP